MEWVSSGTAGLFVAGFVASLVGCGDDSGANADTGSTSGTTVATGGTTDGTTGDGTTAVGTGSESTGEGTTSTGSADEGSTTGPPPFDGDVSCLGEPLPPVRDDPATVTGTVLGAVGPVEATIEVLSTADDSVIHSVTTGADGNYSLVVPTGGMPTPVYFHITAPGYVETFRYFGYPLTGNVDTGQRIWSTVEAADYAAIGGIAPVAGTGVLRIAPRDCSLALTREGTTVSTDPAAPVLAFESGNDCDTPDDSLTEMTDCGYAMAYDLDPGTAVVDAMLPDVPFYTQTVRVEADAMTWVTLQPDRQ